MINGLDPHGANGNQNIAPGSGPELLFPPISQFDKHAVH